ncbi:MAG: ZIP family metal transporter, partial [Muricauda sp. TMED12]
MDFPSAIIYIIPIVAVWAGFGFVWLTKPKNNDNIKLLLAFSGAFLLSLTFFELLPDVY